MVSLAKLRFLTLFPRLIDVKEKKELSKIDIMELARVYSEVADNCFRRETIDDYLETLEDMLDIRQVFVITIGH